jgi:hypothetical protein
LVREVPVQHRLYERIRLRSPDRPQPTRALALALAKRASDATPYRARRDLTRALRLFHEVVMTPWPGDFEGIELIALMDANALVEPARELGIDFIDFDPRLLALLDVDLRIVIEWNTDATDMDLWVTEPTREKAVYDNPLTRIGGRLSNDMTSGFGPEEYLLGRAPDGRYQIAVNVYASDAIDPNGATIVTARLIRDFGRPTHDFELRPDDKGANLIGEFVVNKEQAARR